MIRKLTNKIGLNFAYYNEREDKLLKKLYAENHHKIKDFSFDIKQTPHNNAVEDLYFND